MKLEGKCLEFMKSMKFPFMKCEGKCSGFMKSLDFSFMQREGKCPEFTERRILGNPQGIPIRAADIYSGN